jgi:hypothetical protein
MKKQYIESLSLKIKNKLLRLFAKMAHNVSNMGDAARSSSAVCRRPSTATTSKPCGRAQRPMFC